MKQGRLLLASVTTALVVVGVAAVSAQAPDRVQRLNDQLGRIFQSSEYSVPRFGPARWLPDGTAYAIVERSADRKDAWDIVRYEAATGARSVILSGTRLVPPGASTPLGIDNYAWSPDGNRLLIFTNTKKVWRDNTRGDYWVLDIASGQLKKLGGSASESSLMFARFSPDSTRVGYVRANNIYVERLDDNTITQLTMDGSQTTINGTSDWVYEEELGVRDSFRWSPDSTHIAYWQFDSTGVGTFSLINTTDSLYPVITTIPYPKAGTTNSAARIGVIPATGGETRWMNTPGDPRENYLARMEWLDARTIAIQQLNRLQNENHFFLADVRNGEVRRSYLDESKAWVDVEEVQWIDKGQSFLWITERDGWRHIVRVPREGGEGKLVTRFEADITGLAGIDEAGGWVYFIASPTAATERYLYRSKLDGTGTPERVTPGTQPGTHSYDIGPGGKLAFHTYSRFDQPPVTDVVDLSDHRVLRTLTDTTALVTKLAPIVKPPVEFFRIGIDGSVTLDGWMLKPSDFDPAKRYPVIVHVYGEPAGQTVADRWGGGRNLFHRALAEAGYLIVSFDNRGTPAPKGAAWRKVIYGTVGDLSSKEQAAAIRALVASRPYVDRDRIGIWGASGGGTNTLNAMFRFPDVYHVGVSVAPVPDQRLYDTIYQERYMGTPQGNGEGYRIGSAVNFAEGLKGRLLIVHGSGDDNVHYQGTERLVNRLIELGKPFET
ncbi:MAG: S9 family peptidase, partial [Vicinamibacterales bacterium]